MAGNGESLRHGQPAGSDVSSGMTKIPSLLLVSLLAAGTLFAQS